MEATRKLTGQQIKALYILKAAYSTASSKWVFPKDYGMKVGPFNALVNRRMAVVHKTLLDGLKFRYYELSDNCEP